MSMILDALKRAERERKLEKAPDLSAIYQEEGLENRKGKRRLWLGGAVLMIFVALAVVYWLKETSEPDVTASAPQQKVLSKSPSEPKASTRKAVQNTSPPQPDSTARKKTLEMEKKAPAAKRATALAKKSVEPPPVPIGGLLQKAPDLAAAVPPPPHDLIKTAKPPPKPVKQPVVSNVREQRSTGAVKVASETKPKREYPSFDDLPEEIQSVSGPLEINVHMYSPKPSERRVFINMKGYRQGDIIEETGFKLVEITPDGVVIDYGKGKAVLSVKRK